MTLPILEQFRIERHENGLVHLIFDCPGRTMNVFSEAAIADLGTFAAWLATADVAGVLLRSGKANAFCAGADLTELGIAYDMIRAAREPARFNLAYDHFFPLSKAIRALETAGKPVAVAVAGIALGGGCELALGAHFRVLVDDPGVGMGLPESLVGLLPGAGGTQRLPRLIGVEAALPVLLDGARLTGRAALDAGLVHALAAPGEEIEVAERWLLSGAVPLQPWDREDWVAPRAIDVAEKLVPVRERVLGETLGHYPAPLAILDCIEFGLPQGFDGAIRTEMSIFSPLIQREEARNMIQTLFLGRTDYDRLARKEALPASLSKAVAAVRTAMESLDPGVLAELGFHGYERPAPLRGRAGRGYWSDTYPPAQDALRRLSDAVAPFDKDLAAADLRIADYAIVKGTGYPGWLGGPFAYRRRMGGHASG